ncbi:MAG TPA: enoyl-CoA hydratase-related protein [Syntrophales bacterium]|nr:enoyl-CoA hydratase-related protein [Syntrophales bacterium]HOM07185.1 enoyl-CoA hydratase-related protein [Syntrophales bacterium]HOO00227.1 enoyl-CoA hydratase-related protein [Syntrophales bacterium]HPC01374.1 enoyl-CoA hydratase-related protein [Syntrophales bacterium]HPQ06736.1 enoyl-CoA hydratase-related protein [Syntrophales bacterium]
MEFKNLLYELDGGVVTITINRPKALNALNSEVMGEINAAVTACGKDDAVKAVIITGAGEKSFVAGADISQMVDMKPQQAMAFMEFGIETFRLIETLPKPVIAAVNGFALGGGTELAMSCDFRFASENARFGQPEILIGLIPGWGGTQRLARLVGMGRAKELIMAGDQINAQRAYEIGLVNKVFPLDQLLPETKKFAAKLATLPGFALKMAKHAINFGYDLALDNAMRLETQCCAQCFSTDDQKEGMRAFLEKRKPQFKGC